MKYERTESHLSSKWEKHTNKANKMFVEKSTNAKQIATCLRQLIYAVKAMIKKSETGTVSNDTR